MTAQIKSSQVSLLDPLGTSPSLLLIQYDLASSFAPILRQIVLDMLASQIHVIFVSLVLPAEKYIGSLDHPRLHTIDYTNVVPGYSMEPDTDILSTVAGRVSSVPKGSLALVIDSADTILADSGSHAHTIDALAKIFGHIVQQSSSSRLVLPVTSQSVLLSSLMSTTFHARVKKPDNPQPPPIHALIHLILHSPVLLSYLVQQYHLILPPVDTIPELSTSRFWSVFTLVARRGTGERLVMSVGLDEMGGGTNQSTNREQSTGVAELRTRSRAGGEKGVRTVLRGWRFDYDCSRIVWCGWDDIPALHAFATRNVDTGSSTTMDNVSFNLQLSDAQQQARASVPLPYTNEGKAEDGEIIYIPDQADDFDDDDPDDDLYI